MSWLEFVDLKFDQAVVKLLELLATWLIKGHYNIFDVHWFWKNYLKYVQLGKWIFINWAETGQILMASWCSKLGNVYSTSVVLVLIFRCLFEICFLQNVLFCLSVPIVILNVVEVGLVEDRLSVMIAIRVLISNPSSLISKLRCCLVFTKHRLTSKWVIRIVLGLSYEVTALNISWSCEILTSQEQHLFVEMTNYRYFRILSVLLIHLIIFRTSCSYFALWISDRWRIDWILRLI